MNEKKSTMDAMKDDAIDTIVRIITQYDEDAILPLLFTAEDIVLAYYKEKYGDILTLDEVESIRHDVNKTIGRYKMSRDEVEHYDNAGIDCIKYMKDELPFD